MICKGKAPQQEANAQVVDQEEEDLLFVATCFSSKSSTDSWLIDSGYTNHMTHDKSLFKELKPTKISKVRIGNGDHLPLKGIGTIAIKTDTSIKKISEVLYVHEIDQNLLSVGHLMEKGFKLFFGEDHCQISDTTGNEILRVKMRGRSFSFDPTEKEQFAYSTKADVTEIWHKRLDHCHLQALLLLKKEDMTRGLPTLVDHLPSCQACQFGKQNRKPFPKSSWRTSQKLQLMHTDVAGPQRTPSFNGSLYYVIFIDDYTRFCWIFFIKYKSEVAGIFWKFKKMVENQSGCRIQSLRSDNGKEYNSEEFKQFCEEEGITHQLTTPYTPQQNGVSERKNRYIMEMTRWHVA